jgi:hypothetical protein
MAGSQPEVQLISNLVVTNREGHVLFVRYHPDDERWWLPGEDLEPYQHPDDLARQILGGFPGLRSGEPAPSFVESFRGRRSWHVVFHYRAEGSGRPGGDLPTGWFPPHDLPRTMHGRWEVDVVRRVLASDAPRVAGVTPGA